MAKKERQFRPYNRIWFLAVTLVLVIVTIWGTVGSFMPSSMALEQETRCQMSEHIHTDTCYLDNVLVCDKKAHTHNENCYLVLLKDNDINTLLTAVDAEEDNSLEEVINTTLTQALAADGVATGDEETDLRGRHRAVGIPQPQPDTCAYADSYPHTDSNTRPGTQYKSE